MTPADAVRTTEEHSRSRIAEDGFERMMASRETNAEKREQNNETIEMMLKQ
jgi:hypothetical protein